MALRSEVDLEASVPDAFQDRHLPPDGNRHAPAIGIQSIAVAASPMTELHLYSHLDDEARTQRRRIKRVYIFSAIALFILLIACINYMNLSTARSLLRAREIGVRKVSGCAAQASWCCSSFSESVLMTLLATC
jgi:putative ABC transport system permease protein